MKPLKSHPDLLLSAHVHQVQLALEGICGRHSARLITADVRRLAELVARFHDAGKASACFQTYIVDPAAYAGNRDDKMHTPLSLVLTLLAAGVAKWNAHDALILAACVIGHHGAFPCLPPENAFEDDGSAGAIASFNSGRIKRVLKKQVITLKPEDLGAALGFSLERKTLTERDIASASSHLEQKILPWFYELARKDLSEGVAYRLKAQLLYSMLLEADKAFLAVSDARTCLEREPRPWRAEWIDRLIGSVGDKAINRLRHRARDEVMAAIEAGADRRIFAMTAPTGIGKTLLAATWALKMRDRIAEEDGAPPKVIIVLPFLSIIDQTVRVYKRLLKEGGMQQDGAWLLTSHSLSDRKYDPSMEEGTEEFLIDTWRSELVITTYDQFLMSLAGPRAKHQIRFHNLCDALIVIDEAQSVPCILWRLVNALCNGLVHQCNSRLLIMSATLPPFISNAVPLLENHGRYFAAFSRYRLRMRLGEKLSIDDFAEEMAERLPRWLAESERVLITLNTRASARKIYDHLVKNRPAEHADAPFFFISADVAPRDRLKKIRRITENKPCIVVSTQCIEAGVDIDMSRVIRDFGPWDSIVQIAGRCNREGERGTGRPVEIVDLASGNGHRFSEMIYNETALQVTRRLIGNKDEIGEEDILSVSERYFQALSENRDTGQEHLARYAQWRNDTPIHELLRGEAWEEYIFLLKDRCLMKAMKRANGIDDRWRRRTAWRKLSGKIARISVSVRARPGFRPESIAFDHLGHWILREDCYDFERGILIGDETADTGVLIL